MVKPVLMKKKILKTYLSKKLQTLNETHKAGAKHKTIARHTSGERTHQTGEHICEAKLSYGVDGLSLL